MARPEKLDGVLGRRSTHYLPQMKGPLSARVTPRGVRTPWGAETPKKLG